MQTIEKYPVDPNQVNDNPPPDIKQVLIIDAMAVIHSLKKKNLPTTKTLQDLKELFLQKIDHLSLGFDEGPVM